MQFNYVLITFSNGFQELEPEIEKELEKGPDFVEGDSEDEDDEVCFKTTRNQINTVGRVDLSIQYLK